MNILSGLVFIVVSLIVVRAAPSEAEILSLPLVDFQLNFKQYSGYLNTSAETRKFHYWFLESQNDTANDPLVLWLTGGPGCSSLGGLMDENGPFKVKDQGRRLSENVYSWNKIANVIYLESPAGVGFSYSTADFIADDDSTADDNRAALVHFLQLFPEYRNRPFYVTGESYAGVYIPTLTVRLLKDPTNFPNFKGMAIGNGLLDEVLNIRSLFQWLYFHGLVSEKSWRYLHSNCSSNGLYDPWDALTDPSFAGSYCHNLTQEVLDFPDVSGNDPYDLFYACYPDSTSAVYDVLTRKIQQRFSRKLYHPSMTIAKYLKDSPKPKKTEEECSENTWNQQYLNRQDVLKALHIVPQSPFWKSCSYNVSMTYNATYMDVRAEFKEILSRTDFHSLIYNGDTDMACNFLGDQIFVYEMGQKLITDKDAWRYEGSIVDIAGYATIYERLDFLTVRGSGHFVPTSKPREALQMLSNFLQGSSNYSRPCLADTKPSPLLSSSTEFVISSTTTPSYPTTITTSATTSSTTASGSTVADSTTITTTPTTTTTAQVFTAVTNTTTPALSSTSASATTTTTIAPTATANNESSTVLSSSESVPLTTSASITLSISLICFWLPLLTWKLIGF